MKNKTIKHKDKLNPNQDLFCFLYATDKECFGNGTKAYMCAYNLPEDKRESAQRSASVLLRNVEVKKKINFFLDQVISPVVVDRELMSVIFQDIDKGAKVAAIREYNRIKNRVSDKISGELVVRWEDDSDESSK